ncbi:hypothetical protein Gogos_007284 [Gossypium gossypioides]|uniref:Replication protein A C-terminal domain-containing protein n=1 Tax=Gossypium gossypioides TaxID=34282 RepID=A0A7J9C848_GOSGO|nr:hypothetical protein [Gossypium gossypioides]
MPSQATQTAPDRPSSSSKNSDARCLTPVTVKQLKDLSKVGESGISIDGVDVNNIVLVGIISKIDNAVSDCTFRVDDGTGWVECTKWPITDFNEIAHHFLECIYVHLYNTKLRPRMTNATDGMTAQPQVANSYSGNHIMGYSYQTNSTNQFSNQYNTDEEQIRGISSMVLQYLRRPACLASEMGVSSDIVARELNVSVDKVRKTLDFLASEGLVYTTTDDHYKFTDA